MSEVSNDDPLQMFFNEDFSPASYVDALYQSIAGTSDIYSSQTLSKISSKTQDLLTHLDYNTNVLLRELEVKMEQLKKLSSLIGVSEYAPTDNTASSENTATSRLEYYADSLRNAVETLSSDVESVRKQLKRATGLENLEPGHGDPIESLLLLKEVKASILKVYHVIQDAKKKVGGSSDLTLSDEAFLAALLLLYDQLKNKWKDGNEEERGEITETVKELRSWVPMFQPFTKFGPVFVKFVVKLENEL